MTYDLIKVRTNLVVYFGRSHYNKINSDKLKRKTVSEIYDVPSTLDSLAKISFENASTKQYKIKRKKNMLGICKKIIKLSKLSNEGC